MQRTALPLNEKGMELMNFTNIDFPCTVFIADIAKYIHSKVPWHWHKEIELFIVTKGTLKMLIGNETYLIQESNGAFINTNILHAMEVAEGENCELMTLVFSPAVISGGKATSLYREITSPIYENPGLAIIPLTKSVPWEREVLSLIQTACQADHDDLFGKQLLICEHLAHIWRLILSHSTQKSIDFNPMQSQRTQTMMKFIQDHYQNSLSVAEIASSAGISTRECSRCFKNTIHISPIEYLMQYRITVSASLLVSTNDPITRIATTVGFNSSSYFTKVFQSIMHMSPTHYKKLHHLQQCPQ